MIALIQSIWAGVKFWIENLSGISMLLFFSAYSLVAWVVGSVTDLVSTIGSLSNTTFEGVWQWGVVADVLNFGEYVLPINYGFGLLATYAGIRLVAAGIRLIKGMIPTLG